MDIKTELDRDRNGWMNIKPTWMNERMDVEMDSYKEGRMDDLHNVTENKVWKHKMFSTFFILTQTCKCSCFCQILYFSRLHYPQ